MTKTHDPDNECSKRAYLVYMREAQQYGEESLAAIAKAIDRFETYTRFRPFKAFHQEQAIGFKKHLKEQRSARTGTPLSLATQLSTLSALKAFFRWLAGQPGFKKRLHYTDASYFSLGRGEERIAKTQREGRSPSLEQVRHAINLMPCSTSLERRDRALVAFILLTGARDGTIPTLRGKHLDIASHRVNFDAREVHTKFSKSFSTWFFPVGDEVLAIVLDWVRFREQEALFGPDEPLFPSTQMGLGQDGGFVAVGLDRKPWSTATPVRALFRRAFTAAGLPYFSPHSLRKTLTRYGQQICKTPEEYKAWSQNLGHEDVMTTFRSYGTVGADRQAEIIRGFTATSEQDSDTRHVRRQA